MKRFWACTALVLATLCGCGTPQQGQSDPDLPKLSDIRPRSAPATQRTGETPAAVGLPGAAPAPMQPLVRQVQRLTVRRLDLPLEASLESAWALADPKPIDAGTLRTWEVNGLRAGVIDQSVWPRFLDALPQVLAHSVQRHSTAGEPVIVTAAPKFDRPVDIRLALPPIDREDPDKSMHWVRLRPGRCQFLVHLQRDQFGSILLEPHHHYPEMTVQVRTPLEKALDGRVFRELPLRVFVPSGKLLIVGLAPLPQVEDRFMFELEPEPERTPMPSPDATLDTTDEQGSQDEQPQPERPQEIVKMPRHLLGSTILAAKRGAKPVQILLVIEAPR